MPGMKMRCIFAGGWGLYRDDMYNQAGLDPADIDFLQTYDDYPVITMLQMEDLGFCGKGRGRRSLCAPGH